MAAVTAVPYAAQSPIDPDINDKIRKEEAAQLAGDADAALPDRCVWPAPHRLTQPQGRRRVGGEDHDGWGMQNGKLEPWEFGFPGWVNEHLSVHATAPFKDALVVEALAWTPGTKGTVKAKAFNLIVPGGSAGESGRGSRGGGPRRTWTRAAGADRSRAHRVSREREVEGRRRSRAGRKACVRARQPRTAGGTPHRHPGAVPVRPGDGQRPAVRHPGTGRTRRRAAAAGAGRSRRAIGSPRPRSTSASARSSSRTRRRSGSTTPARPHGQIRAFDNPAVTLPRPSRRS